MLETFLSGSSATAREHRGAGHLTLGVSGARRNAAVAAVLDGSLVAFCEQERVARVRGVRVDPGSLPREAAGAVLRLAGNRLPNEVRQYGLAEPDMVLPSDLPARGVDHHLAHATTAFFASPFHDAAVLVCDHHSDVAFSVWTGRNACLTPVPWAASGKLTAPASLYSDCAALFGLALGQEHHLEALARLADGSCSGRLAAAICYEDGGIRLSPGWKSLVHAWLSQSATIAQRAVVASAFQQRLGQALVALLQDVRAITGRTHLCLAGGLFYNTCLTTLVSEAAIFDDVFVAPNPGNAGTAAGAAWVAAEATGTSMRTAVSPFLGPSSDLEQIKATLDNCKVSYECLSEHAVIDLTVETLRRGHLVGWFQGRMEWGHRALGNRSILANPLSPYVLENLNVYLKRRQPYRTYGLSVPEADAARLFRGPATSRFMEFEYEVRDRDRLRHVLPEGATRLRVQTVVGRDDASSRFERLHTAFGHATGLPVLVNTSFNGFSEPIVCSPRDAVRVFFGSGLDLLVMDRFIIRK